MTSKADGEPPDLGRYHQLGFDAQENDPELSYQIFTQGRDEARRLGETWWVFFYDEWRLVALIAYVMDFNRALPLAVELMARFNTPEGLAYGDRLSVLDHVLYTYVNTDPIGLRDDLEKGFAYLDGEIPQGPNEPRYVFYHSWRAYLIAIEDHDAAYEMAIRSIALLVLNLNKRNRVWHTAWALNQLCQVCHALGKLDELAGHAEHLIEVSTSRDNLLRTEATGRLWLAVCRRAKGDEKGASKSFHRGMAVLEGLDRRDSICPDAVAAYHEGGGDPRAAVGVRDRELAEVTRKGMLHRAFQVHLERCRLLERAGDLTPADLEAARRSTSHLRAPAWHLAKLRNLFPSGDADAGPA